MLDVNLSSIYTKWPEGFLSALPAFWVVSRPLSFAPEPLWVYFRIRSTKCIGFCSFLFWILQLLLNVCIPIRVIGPRSSKNISVKSNYGYHSSLMPDKFISLLHAVILSYMDVICLGFMIWTSGYMVLFLHRHKQQVQHIHSNRLSPRPSHEARATRTTLIIVSSFVYVYCLSSILSLCITLIVNPKQWLMDTSVLIASFSLLSFVFISSDTHVSKFFRDFWTRKKSFLIKLKQL